MPGRGMIAAMPFALVFRARSRGYSESGCHLKKYRGDDDLRPRLSFGLSPLEWINPFREISSLLLEFSRTLITCRLPIHAAGRRRLSSAVLYKSCVRLILWGVFCKK